MITQHCNNALTSRQWNRTGWDRRELLGKSSAIGEGKKGHLDGCSTVVAISVRIGLDGRAAVSTEHLTVKVKATAIGPLLPTMWTLRE